MLKEALNRFKNFDKSEQESQETDVNINPCLEYCIGACCRNMTFVNLLPDELKLLTPSGTNTIELQDSDTLYDSFDSPMSGVFYINNPDGTSIARINGACPNLNVEGMCEIYDDLPHACQTFEPGSKACDNVRRDNHLRPLKLQPAKK